MLHLLRSCNSTRKVSLSLYDGSDYDWVISKLATFIYIGINLLNLVSPLFGVIIVVFKMKSSLFCFFLRCGTLLFVMNTFVHCCHACQCKPFDQCDGPVSSLCFFSSLVVGLGAFKKKEVCKLYSHCMHVYLI